MSLCMFLKPCVQKESFFYVLKSMRNVQEQMSCNDIYLTWYVLVALRARKKFFLCSQIYTIPARTIMLQGHVSLFVCSCSLVSNNVFSVFSNVRWARKNKRLPLYVDGALRSRTKMLFSHIFMCKNKCLVGTNISLCCCHLVCMKKVLVVCSHQYLQITFLQGQASHLLATLHERTEFSLCSHTQKCKENCLAWTNILRLFGLPAFCARIKFSLFVFLHL